MVLAPVSPQGRLEPWITACEQAQSWAGGLELMLCWAPWACARCLVRQVAPPGRPRAESSIILIIRTAATLVTDSLRAWASLLLLSAAALTLYVWQFADTNSYIGIQPIRQVAEVGYWLIAASWLGVIALLMPWRVRSPIDSFLPLYLIGTALWSATYWPATGLLTWSGAVALATLLLLPALAVRSMRWAARRVHMVLPYLSFGLPETALMPVLASMLAIAALLGYRVAGADAGFDFEEAVLRRLAGRDSFAGNALAAYFMQMGMNGLAPFLAFLGGLHRSRRAVAFAFAFAVFSFWLLAAKAPLLNVGVLAVTGVLVRNGKIVYFSRWLVLALGAVLAVAIVEMLVTDVSVIAEFGIRRVILVSSTLQAYFLDTLSKVGWLGLLGGGVNTAGYASPEYFIGDNYMGSEETNANTNAFLHQLVVSGLGGYVAVVAGTACFVFLIEYRFVHAGRRDGYALAAMLGILLIEQALSTALVSSGLLACLAASALCTSPRRGAERLNRASHQANL